jgi:uncharacterized protein (DUF302 family)
MSYYFSRTLALGFEDAIRRTVEALKREGFGVITEIDVKETLKNKINVDFRNYRILGACNPALAHEALQIEDKVGTMLPCNVVVQSIGDGNTEVAAIQSPRWRRSIIHGSSWRPSASRRSCARWWKASEPLRTAKSIVIIIVKQNGLFQQSAPYLGCELVRPRSVTANAVLNRFRYLPSLSIEAESRRRLT